jgi:hypothetical protein
VIGSLRPRIDVLIDLVMGIALKQEQAGSLLPTKQLITIDRLRKAAETVASHAGSTIDEEEHTRSIAFLGSDAGGSISASQRAAISNWNLDAVHESQDSLTNDGTSFTSFLDSAYGSNSDQPSISGVVEHERRDRDSDSEGDISYEVFVSLAEKGKAAIKAENFYDAEKYLQSALNEVRPESPKRQRKLRKHAVMVDLGFTYCQHAKLANNAQEKLTKAREIFVEVIDAYAEFGAGIGLTAEDALKVSYLLAGSCLDLEEFDEAEKFCKRAMLGWRRLHGKSDRQYFESVKLLVKIYEQKGNPELAVGYASLLPPNPMPVPTRSPHERKNLTKKSEKPPPVIDALLGSPSRVPHSKVSPDSPILTSPGIPPKPRRFQSIPTRDRESATSLDSSNKLPRPNLPPRAPLPVPARASPESKNSIVEVIPIHPVISNSDEIVTEGRVVLETEGKFNTKIAGWFAMDANEALLWAASNGKLKAVQALVIGWPTKNTHYIACKKNVNEKGRHKLNAIQTACRYGHVDVVRYLITLGGDLNVLDLYYYAAIGGHMDVIRTLADASITAINPLALVQLVEKDSLDGVEILLRAGIDPNGRKGLPPTARRVTPISIAVRRDNREMIALLLKWGAEKTLDLI